MGYMRCRFASSAGYPIVALPIGIDPDGMPVGITLVHTQWEEGKLVRWASAIEDLLKHETEMPMSHVERDEVGAEGLDSLRRVLRRVPPTFNEHMRKNVPVNHGYRYEGTPTYSVAELHRGKQAKSTSPRRSS